MFGTRPTLASLSAPFAIGIAFAFVAGIGSLLCIAVLSKGSIFKAFPLVLLLILWLFAFAVGRNLQRRYPDSSILSLLFVCGTIMGAVLFVGWPLSNDQPLARLPFGMLFGTPAAILIAWPALLNLSAKRETNS